MFLTGQAVGALNRSFHKKLDNRVKVMIDFFYNGHEADLDLPDCLKESKILTNYGS